LPSASKANTSATPLALGTAGTMPVTTEPSPALDQITVPLGSVPEDTVTSAEAVPAVTVTCHPSAAAKQRFSKPKPDPTIRKIL
jgi:hypothetical protein